MARKVTIDATRATVADLLALTGEGIALPVSAKGEWEHYATNGGFIRLARPKKGKPGHHFLSIAEADFTRLAATSTITIG
jgi:hypothetical protein